MQLCTAPGGQLCEVRSGQADTQLLHPLPVASDQCLSGSLDFCQLANGACCCSHAGSQGLTACVVSYTACICQLHSVYMCA